MVNNNRQNLWSIGKAQRKTGIVNYNFSIAARGGHKVYALIYKTYLLF